MYWPTQSPAVPLTELGWSNVVYLSDAEPARDSSMVWGTMVELDKIDAFLAAQSRETGRMISVVHVLIQAVSRALMDHPRLNRRVIHRRVHAYDGVSMVVPIRRPLDGIVDVVYFRDTRNLTLADIAIRMWSEARERALKVAQEKRQSQMATTIRSRWTGWLKQWHLFAYKCVARTGLWVTNHIRVPTWGTWDQEMNGANAFVNFLGSHGAPPMISYKPSSVGTNSFGVNVTMGLPENRPVVREGQVVIARQAPMFVRADHRLVNGYQMGEFIETLRSYLANPASLMECTQKTKPDDLASAA